jgi:Ankyrin repeats (3 copies)
MTYSRRRRTIAAVAFAIALLVIANGLLYPEYFSAPVSFKWQAKSGFSAIYVIPPGESVGFLKRFLSTTFATEARPFIASYMRKSGWEVGEGQFWVKTIPFPPVVIGLNRSAEWRLTDPMVTPLMQAADRGDLQSVKALLAAGVGVNSHDQRGWTPLMHACKSTRASKEIVQAMLAAGADVHARDAAGRTALIWAPLSGSDGPGKVRALLAAHADPNVRSSFGETPLERAVESPSPDAADTVAQLLAAGADPNAKVLEGTTVLAIAKAADNTGMVHLLRTAGARE